jgi:hypothetical protein
MRTATMILLVQDHGRATRSCDQLRDMVILYHAAPVVRALAIMLRGFHDRRDAKGHPSGFGIPFVAGSAPPDRANGIILRVDDTEPLRPYATALWRDLGTDVIGSHGYVLPADVANCYLPRMIGDVGVGDRLDEV